MTQVCEEYVHKANQFYGCSMFLHRDETLCCQRGCDCGE